MSNARRRFAPLLPLWLTVVLAAGVLPAFAMSGAAAAPGDPGYARATTYRPAVGTGLPEEFHAVTIDLGKVRSALRDAPRAGSRGAGLSFEVPSPEGGSERFEVRQTQVMAAELAARHPEITTYYGRSLDVPGSTIAVDVTPMGFHAAVRRPQGERDWYVDPATKGRGTAVHLSYYGGDLPRAENTFVERETPRDRQLDAAPAPREGAPGAPVVRRIYRLAMLNDPAYAQYFGTENVLAEKVTLINRVNQIYQDDLAIWMRLVNETDELNLDTEAKATGANGPCGANPCYEPGTADGFGQLDFCDIGTLGRNRTVLGQLVGASNYDVGHIALGVDGGGVAFLGVVGYDYKAGGCTGLSTPKGDFFAIDYVAHELGHQYSGNHTFNGVVGNCQGGNRNGGTSVEPGSGSSVMAYAGICGQDDLQPHTDPYFSQRTLSEVTSYVRREATDVAEVQTVSLEGFDAGDSFRLTYDGDTSEPDHPRHHVQRRVAGDDRRGPDRSGRDDRAVGLRPVG